MIQKKWFRVETGKDGSVLSCEEVEAKGKAVGSVVRFYEAADKADACQQAKQWYQHHRDVSNRINGKIREARLSLGMCIRCNTRKHIKNRKQCRKCLQKAVEHAKKVATGEHVPTPRHHDPAKVRKQLEETSQRFRDARRSQYGSFEGYKLTLLLNKFDEMGHTEFRKWLVSRIESERSKISVTDSLPQSAKP